MGVMTACIGEKNATRSLPHSDNEHQLSVNNCWSCILGNQVIVQMSEFITVLLTAFVLLNRTHKRKNIVYKIANVATRKVFKNRILDVSWALLIEYSYRTPKARALSECTDGPAWHPTANPPYPDGLGAVHRTIPELTVRVSWRPAAHIWRQFGSDPDPKRRSRTVPTTR